MRALPFCVAALLAAAAAQPADSQPIRYVPEMTYADLADLALAAPVVAEVELRKASRLKPEEAPGVPPGHTRFLIEADVISLIRGAAGLPPRVRYVVDVPVDGRGRAAKPQKRSRHLVLAAPVRGAPDELRLIDRDAQIPFTPAAADLVRDILRASLAADAPPAITGVGRAFHVPGSLPGESETQIFLATADQRPVSLNVLRRPGRRPEWSVAMGEFVDQGAGPPPPDTLLWYRLACFLPRSVPAETLRDAGTAAARAIEADYRVVLEGLGPCARNRAAR